MPLVGMRCHPVLGEAAHLHPHFIHGFIETAVAVGERAARRNHQCDKPRPRGRRAALLHQMRRSALVQSRHVAMRKSHIAGAGKFRLVHRNAARNLVQIFTSGDLHEQAFDLREFSRRSEPPCIGRKFLQRGHIGGQPRQSVRRMLLTVDQRRLQLAAC